MVVTPTIKDFIVKDELEQIYDLVKKGSYNDMITMNMSLLQVIKEDLVEEAPEEAPAVEAETPVVEEVVDTVKEETVETKTDDE